MIKKSTILLLALLMLTSIMFVFSGCENKSTETSSLSESSNEDLIKLSKEINSTLGSSNVYFSADGIFMYIEVRNWKNEYNETKFKELFKILKDDFCKENIKIVTILLYMDQGEDKNNLVIRHVYDVRKETDCEAQETYVNFDTYSEAMKALYY